MECGTSLSYAYFALFIVVIQMMMLNLFIAVVLEGFSSTNKEHTGSVTSEHFNELIDKWIHYDQEATGWIDVRDLIFLIYELSEPLGRFTEYDQDIKDQFLQQDAAFGQKNMMNGVVEQGMRFVVSMDREMIVPFLRALPLLQEMALPVYSDFQDHTRQYQCHFRDVCKKLTRIALMKKNPNYDDGGIEPKHKKILSRAWVEKYTDIKHKKVLKGFNTGQLWAGLFIVSCVRNVCNMRKQKKMRIGIQEKRPNFQSKPSKKKEDQDNEHGSCSHDQSELQSENKTVVNQNIQNQPADPCTHIIAFQKTRSPASKFRNKMGLKGKYLSSSDLQAQKQEQIQRQKKIASYGPQQQKNKSSKKRQSLKPKKEDDEFELSMETIRQIKQKAKEENLRDEDLEFLLHIQRWKKKTEMTKQMIANKTYNKKTEKNDQVEQENERRSGQSSPYNTLKNRQSGMNLGSNNDERMVFMEEDYDPKFKKDIDRSTWWMNNKRLNYKMSNWVKQQDFKNDQQKKDKMLLDLKDLPVQKSKSHMVPNRKMSESSFRTHQ